uniref:Uncharacterized protein n=1 Tax=Phlebotomus papatasi TaxID=29031 RepID=A0A1B0DAI0_PHLPP
MSWERDGNSQIMSTVDANLALGASEDFLNKAIRIGLYLSATFQVICLTTIIFLPTSFMKCFNNWDSKSKKHFRLEIIHELVETFVVEIFVTLRTEKMHLQSCINLVTPLQALVVS